MTPTVHKFTDAKEFAEKSAQAIESFLADQFQKKRILKVALSGGQGSQMTYRMLAESQQIDWSRIALFLVDERVVPLNSPDSNGGMIQKILTGRLKNLRRFYAYNTRETVSKLVSQYEALLSRQGHPLFDLVILGLGADGHVASLFPKSPALAENRRLVLHTHSYNPGAAGDRMTLTFPAILDSEKIIFLIQGKAKAGILDRWLNGNESFEEIPAKKILEHPAVEIFYLEN